MTDKITFKNDTIDLLIEEGSEDLVTYSMLVLECIASINPEGATIGQQRELFRLIDSLESSNGVITFDVKFLDLVKKSVKEHVWNFAHRDLLKFEDVIIDL